MKILFRNEPNATDGIFFCSDGKISAQAYSYQIGDIGEVELSEHETKRLYLIMKEYYKSRERVGNES